MAARVRVTSVSVVFPSLCLCPVERRTSVQRVAFTWRKVSAEGEVWHNSLSDNIMESESIMKPGHSWKQQTEVESYTISTCVFGEKLAHCVSLRQRQSCFDNLVMIHHWSKAEGRGAERVPHVALSLAVRQPSPEFSLSAPWIHQRNANLMSVVRQTQMFRPKYVHFICSGRGFHYQKKKTIQWQRLMDQFQSSESIVHVTTMVALLLYRRLIAKLIVHKWPLGGAHDRKCYVLLVCGFYGRFFHIIKKCK